MKRLILIIALLSMGCTGLGRYNEGQFSPDRNPNFIKLNTPESDDYNPKLNDLLHPEYWNTQPSDWDKRCEWWLKRDLGY